METQSPWKSYMEDLISIIPTIPTVGSILCLIEDCSFRSYIGFLLWPFPVKGCDGAIPQKHFPRIFY